MSNAMKLIADLRVKFAAATEHLNELEHSLAVKSGEEVLVEWDVTPDTRICVRCGRVLGRRAREWAVRIDDRYWHKHDCGAEHHGN